MKRFLPAGLVILLGVTATNAYAAITCDKPKLAEPVAHGSVYRFKATVTCNITGSTINIGALKDSYRAEITSPKSQFKVHDQHSYDDKQGLTGYWLDTTQSYKSDHGPMVVRGEILLLDNNKDKFYQELKTKSVSGEGDAQYDKYILNQVTLQVLPDHAELTVVKVTDVEEPWYAPHGTFVDTVESDLVDSITKSAENNAHKMIGESVDALRK